MGTTLVASCADVSGDAAAFVVGVYVYVDGVLVAERTHEAPPTGGERWSFSVPLDLVGTHTIRVTDQAASGPIRYEVLELTVDCPVPAQTATMSTTTTEPVATIPVIVIDTLPVPNGSTTVVLVTAPTIPETSTTTPETTATALASTTVPANTLPATGAASDGLVGVGIGLLVLGALCVFGARRRVARPCS